MKQEISKILDIIKEVKPSLQDIDETTVLNEGVLDSLDIITIVSLMEKEFKVKIDGICLKQENFETAVTLWNMIEKL